MHAVWICRRAAAYIDADHAWIVQKFVGNAVGYVPTIEQLLPLLGISSREVGKPLCEARQTGARRKCSAA